MIGVLSVAKADWNWKLLSRFLCDDLAACEVRGFISAWMEEQPDREAIPRMSVFEKRL